MIRAWPTRKRRASTLGLAAISASSLTPYIRAIELGLSPALTICVRGVAAGVAASRLEFVALTGAGWADAGNDEDS